MEQLKELTRKEVTKMFEKVLDYVQVAVAAPDTYKVIRAKILRAGNDCIRNIHQQLEEIGDQDDSTDISE